MFLHRVVIVAAVLALPVVSSCGQVNVPGARHASVPSPKMADQRPEAINEKPDSVLYLPLGSDVLVPEVVKSNPLPSEHVGPFELRSETLAGALQLILADYEIPLAFETEEGLTRTITVANLRGPLNKVVERVCGLADLYCAYEDGLLVVKQTQTFTVGIPPIGGEDDVMGMLATGLQAITGLTPITEEATRTIIYEATNRTSKLAERYFQKIRSNTALIVFEVYIWEVALDAGNDTGINWENIDSIGKFDVSINLPGGALSESPVSIGLPTTQGDVGVNDVFEFISSYGAVKTISQPQITVLSGSEATLRAADTENYVSSFTRTIDDGEVAVSTEVESVDTGFTMTISSTWDKSTIYTNIEIDLQEVIRIEPFVSGEGTDSEVRLGLPLTTERELSTQVRTRPGDSLLIAGLVRESDDVQKSGPGFTEPFFPTTRRAETENTEVVFLLRPRVIVYTADDVSNSGAGLSAVSRQGGHREQGFPTGTISPDMLDPSGL